MTKMANNPMQSAHAALRCAAESKRSGMQSQGSGHQGQAGLPDARREVALRSLWGASWPVRSWPSNSRGKSRTQGGPGPYSDGAAARGAVLTRD